MVLVRHVRFALARAWTTPVRSAIALCIAALAWSAIFSAAAAIAKFDDSSTRAGQLGGLPGYQVSVKRVYDEQGVLRSSLLPRNLIDKVHARTGALVLELDRTIGIVSADRQSTSPKRVLLYGEGLGVPEHERRDFPVCALYRADDEWKHGETLIPLTSGWRCQLLPLPAPLAALSHSVDSEDIAFPLARADEAAGLGALDHVQTMWIGFATPAERMELAQLAERTYKLALEVVPLGVDLAGQSASISASTRNWLIMAILALILAIVLYVHGVYRAMRCELGLRICLGVPLAGLARWLLVDVLAQAASLTIPAALAGWLLHRCFETPIGAMEAARLLAMACAALTCLFSVMAVAVTLFAVRSSKIITTIRQ